MIQVCQSLPWGEGSSMSFCQLAQKVGKTFMTLNNLELRHNARGISNSKPLEHLEPIQCGRYRAWKLGSDTLKTIHTPRHVDIKSVILHQKLYELQDYESERKPDISQQTY